MWITFDCCGEITFNTSKGRPVHSDNHQTDIRCVRQLPLSPFAWTPRYLCSLMCDWIRIPGTRTRFPTWRLRQIRLSCPGRGNSCTARITYAKKDTHPPLELHAYIVCKKKRRTQLDTNKKMKNFLFDLFLTLTFRQGARTSPRVPTSSLQYWWRW